MYCFEMSLNNSEALSIQVNALNLTCQPLTLTWHGSSELVGGVKIDGDFFSASIWYQSLGWWWRWFNVSCKLFLTRMFHHLVEPFDRMKYHWFGQQNFSNWVEQDVSYRRWCHQHFVSWLSCLMFHHLVEPFDSMNYHRFGQHIFSNWVEQDVSYSRWCL